MRAAHRYPYVVVADFDEFIRGIHLNQTLPALAKSMDASHIGSFVFKVLHFAWQRNSDPNSESYRPSTTSQRPASAEFCPSPLCWLPTASPTSSPTIFPGSASTLIDRSVGVCLRWWCDRKGSSKCRLHPYLVRTEEHREARDCGCCLDSLSPQASPRL